ncbi:hypothetical protein HanRHA438_Chr01g0032231 [Helianthus annuus]|nr:hypothetical protein HanRHA438_Chr01g0032231 [Helianthus annuus]
MEEYAEHLFCGCGTASGVWSLVSQWCGIPPIYAFTVRDLLDLYKSVSLSSVKKEVLHGVIIIACWRKWKARNEMIFASKKMNVVKIFVEVKALGFLWFFNRYKKKCIDWKDWCSFNFV